MNLFVKLQLTAVLFFLGSPAYIAAFQQHTTCLGIKCRRYASSQPVLRYGRHGYSHAEQRRLLHEIHMESGTTSSSKIRDNSENGDAAKIPDSSLPITNAITHNAVPSPQMTEETEKSSKNKKKVTFAVAGILATCIAVVFLSGPGAWRYYLAGGICAAISHAITTPVDVIKVRNTPTALKHSS